MEIGKILLRNNQDVDQRGNKVNDKYESQMKKGVLDMLVLKLLAKEEMYGYQIISELKQQSEGRFTLKEGTLYPVLYRLEDDGLVESKWSEVKEKKQVPRKYYVITNKGRQELVEIEKLWRAIQNSVAQIMNQ